jgi:hypothetical protein
MLIKKKKRMRIRMERRRMGVKTGKGREGGEDGVVKEKEE